MLFLLALLVLAFRLFVLACLLRLEDFQSLLLLPLRIRGQLGREIGSIGFDFFFFFGLVLCAEIVEVCNEEINEFDFRKVLFELIFFLSLLITLLILSSACITFLVGNLFVLDAVLPLNEVNELLLLPVLVLLLTVFIPDFVAISTHLCDLLLQFLQACLLSLFPCLVLFIVAILLLGFL